MRSKSSCLISFALLLGLALCSAAHADLVGWWRLDDGSGTVALDSSPGGNDGTLVGDPKWTAGKVGGALECDGGDYVDVPGASDINPENLTLMTWVNFTTVDSGAMERQDFLSRGDDYAFTLHEWNADGIIHGVLTSAGGWSVVPGQTVVEADRWYHLALTYDSATQMATLYLDSEVEGELSVPAGLEHRLGGSLTIGTYNGRDLLGKIDDVKIFDNALSQGQIKGEMAGGGFPYAFGPSPADGTILEATWVTMTWKSGDFTVSHDVYFADNFDDVNNASEAAFQGSQPNEMFIAGFFGFPFPDGLVPGTTYYWRIDEVNDSEPNSPWVGPIWSFFVPPRTAYAPSVPDGATFVASDLELGWRPGFGAKLHTVYFGDNFDDVNNATGGMPQATATFDPGALELEKTYYWRVDESDPPAVHKGQVWSFTTTLSGLGTAVAERWENIPTTDINALKTNARFPNNPDATEDVTEFAWDGPDLDDYGGRISAWLYVPATGDYTFWLNTDDQGELWLSTDDDPGNAKLIAQESNWAGLNAWGGGEEQSDPIPLIGGEKYYIEALWKEGGGGDHCQVAWQGAGIATRTVIAGTNLSPFEPMSAYGAKPSNQSTGVTLVPILKWKPGLEAASHEVYFGTDEQAVANATKASPEYKGSRQFGDESYDPGKLAWDSSYYWRVDEINATNPESPWVGAVWTFATGAFLVVDDFESYDDIDPAPGEPGINRIFDKWIDGFGTMTNGALVGNDLPPYAERTVVRTGNQSMIYRYDNAGKTSEATLTLVYPKDWTEEGVTKLSLWINGDAANAPDRIYVALNGTAVIYHDDPAATQIEGWTEWVIDLAAFGVNLTNVNSISIGVGTKNAPSPAGGTGTIHVDDIRLIR